MEQGNPLVPVSEEWSKEVGKCGDEHEDDGEQGQDDVDELREDRAERHILHHLHGDDLLLLLLQLHLRYLWHRNM